MWEYTEAGRLLTYQSIAATECVFCQSPLLRLPAKSFDRGEKRLFIQPSICQCCGWWTVYRVLQGAHSEMSQIEEYSASIGCLKELDLRDVSIPLDEVRQYLLAKRESIFEIHPRLFEDVVGSVFKDLGWTTRVTAYIGDDGVDIILDGPEDGLIGVQVKRYSEERRIEAEQIRSLAGALLVNGLTRGVFVTTSTFRKGAKRTACSLASIGYPIELIDGERFLDALGIAQRKSFELQGERFISCLLSPGVHLGSSMAKPFVPGENLIDREIVASTMSVEDIIDLALVGRVCRRSGAKLPDSPVL